MKYLITLTLLLFFLSSFTYSQEVKVEYMSPVFTQYGPDWSSDRLVSNTEPFGKLTGAAKSNGTIYLAVPDTNIVSNRCIIVYRSTNFGNNWSTFASVQPAAIIPRTKMVRSGLDSVYLFFLFGSLVYTWNVENNNFNQFTNYTDIRDFDAEASSTGAVYLAIDRNVNNDIRFFGSTNGGVSWPTTVFLSSTGARVRWHMCPGDTLAINYYGPVLADTPTSVIRTVRYRQTAPGTITLTGSFTNVETSTAPKTEFQSVYNGGTIWFFYTSGLTGAIDIYCKVSSNGGTSYGSPFLVAGNPNTDEYWFEVKHFLTGVSGVDLAYYSDSLQSGNPTNNTDKMMYRFANVTTPETFSAAVAFSEHPPGWSARGYIPAMVEVYNSSDVGVAWVGLDGSNRRVWWDSYLAPVGISNNHNEIPNSYVLKQNYPNPFNPATKIEFAIPKDEFITLKAFDMLGREVSLLISKNLKAGSYTVDFDASRLSTGVYFYRLNAGSFSDTKKMILVK